MTSVGELFILLESWLSEVRVIRAKRVPPSVRRKRKQYYRRRKARIKRLARMRRRKPRAKRMAKRRAAIRKRLHLRPGSRRRIRLASIGTMAKLTEGLKMVETKDLIRGFENAMKLSEQLISLVGKKLEESKQDKSDPSPNDFHWSLPALTESNDLIDPDFQNLLGIKKPVEERHSSYSNFDKVKADSQYMIDQIKAGKADIAECEQILTMIVESLDKAVEKVISEEQVAEAGERAKPVEHTVKLTLNLGDVAKALGYKEWTKVNDYLDADSHDDVYHNGYTEKDAKGMSVRGMDDVEKIFPQAVAIAAENAEREGYSAAIRDARIEAIKQALEMIQVSGEYQSTDGDMVSVPAGIKSAEVEGNEVTIEVENPEHLINDLVNGVGMFHPDLDSYTEASEEEIKSGLLGVLNDYFDVYGGRKPDDELSSQYSPDIDDEFFKSEVEHYISEMSIEDIAQAVVDAVDSGDFENENQAIALAAKYSGQPKKEIAKAVKGHLAGHAEKLGSRAAGTAEEQKESAAGAFGNMGTHSMHGYSMTPLHQSNETQKYAVFDWAGNYAFDPQGYQGSGHLHAPTYQFDSFEEAEEWLDQMIAKHHEGEDYHEVRGEYEILPVPVVGEDEEEMDEAKKFFHDQQPYHLGAFIDNAIDLYNEKTGTHFLVKYRKQLWDEFAVFMEKVIKKNPHIKKLFGKNDMRDYMLRSAEHFIKYEWLPNHPEVTGEHGMGEAGEAPTAPKFKGKEMDPAKKKQMGTSLPGKFVRSGDTDTAKKIMKSPRIESVDEAKGKWIIIDWAGNVMFGEKKFNSFEDAEEFLSQKLGDDYDTDRQEYDIVQGKTRDSKYLDPNDPRAGKKFAESIMDKIESLESVLSEGDYAVWEEVPGKYAKSSLGVKTPTLKYIGKVIAQDEKEALKKARKLTTHNFKVTQVKGSKGQESEQNESKNLEEADPSLQPPKKWFNKMLKTVKGDDKAAIVGAIWRDLSTEKKKEIRGREGKEYGPAESKVMEAGKWEPDAEDLYDYASNVEHLYNAMEGVTRERQALSIAQDIIDDYNGSNEEFPERQYKGSAQELASYIMSMIEPQETEESVTEDQAAEAMPKSWFERLAKQLKDQDPKYTDELVKDHLEKIWKNHFSSDKRKEVMAKESKKHSIRTATATAPQSEDLDEAKKKKPIEKFVKGKIVPGEFLKLKLPEMFSDHSELYVSKDGRVEISIYYDAHYMADEHMDLDKKLTEQCSDAFDETYNKGGWANWREEWIQSIGGKVGYIGSGNTYNNDSAYFWSDDVFEFTHIKLPDGQDGAIIMWHYGGDVRGNYSNPEVYVGDFESFYSSMDVGSPNEEIAYILGYNGDYEKLVADVKELVGEKKELTAAKDDASLRQTQSDKGADYVYPPGQQRSQNQSKDVDPSKTVIESEKTEQSMWPEGEQRAMNQGKTEAEEEEKPHSYDFTDKESQIEALAEFINDTAKWRYEYETEHVDAGNNYADAYLLDNPENIVGEYLKREPDSELAEVINKYKNAGHNLKEIGKIAISLVTPEPGGIEREENALDSAPIGEIEDQITHIYGRVNGKEVNDVYGALSAGLSKEDLSQVAKHVTEAYWKPGEDYIYVNAGNDSWKFMVDPEALEDALAQQFGAIEDEEPADESLAVEYEGKKFGYNEAFKSGINEMATAKSTIKKYEALKTKKMWSKQEILGVAHRMSDLDRGWAKDSMDEEFKYILHELLAMFEEGHTVDITPEQSEQGIDWLKRNVINNKGELRNNGMVRDAGFTQEDAEIIKNFKKFELVGFKHDANAHVYAPIYRTIAQNGDHFDYSVSGGFGGAAIELHRD